MQMPAINRLLVLLALICLFAISSIKPDEPDSEHHHEESDHADHHTAGHRPDDPDLPIHHHNQQGHKSGEDDDLEHSETDAEYDHNMVTGSEQQAEEFKDLTPEESKSRLGVLAKRMDANTDGFVSKEELYKWLINSFVSLDNERSKSQMAEVDSNKDELVTWGEYLKKHFGHTEAEWEKLKKEKAKDMEQFLQSIESDHDKFKMADRNKDGSLNLEEFTAFSHPQNYAWMAPYELKRTLQDFDTNKDKKISFQEFLGQGKMSDEAKKHEQETFAGHDTDKNGFLEDKEIVQWAMPGFEKAATDEQVHLFKETDKNKDGKLSISEITDQSEMWVGSQATNYGSHLEKLKKDEL